MLTATVSLVMLFSSVSAKTLCNSLNFTAKILNSDTAHPAFWNKAHCGFLHHLQVYCFLLWREWNDWSTVKCTVMDTVFFHWQYSCLYILWLCEIRFQRSILRYKWLWLPFLTCGWAVAQAAKCSGSDLGSTEQLYRDERMFLPCSVSLPMSFFYPQLVKKTQATLQTAGTKVLLGRKIVVLMISFKVLHLP